MIKAFLRNLVLTAGIALIIMLVSGCREQVIADTNSSGARTKLLATKNRELKKEINSLKKQHKNEIRQLEKLLGECLREKGTVVKASTEEIKDLIEASLKDVNEENSKLRQENNRLKRRIAQLEKEIEELRKKPAIPASPQPL
jgi:cell division septum initiation protein DivIVA